MGACDSLKPSKCLEDYFLSGAYSVLGSGRVKYFIYIILFNFYKSIWR